MFMSFIPCVPGITVPRTNRAITKDVNVVLPPSKANMGEDFVTAWKSCSLNGNEEVKEVNNKIFIGGRSWPRDLDTIFLVKQGKGQSKNDARKFYTVGEIYFFMKNQDLAHVPYMRKAEENHVRSVRRPDRKMILTALSASKPTLRSSKSNTEVPAKKIKIETDECEKEEEKPRLRTYSRQKLEQSTPAPSRKMQDQAQSSATSSSSIIDKLTNLQCQLQTLQHTVDSMTAFLRDFLGLTPNQLQILQSGCNNPRELRNIASSIQKQYPGSSAHMENHDSFGNNLDITSNEMRFCYKAEKHPTRGWEMIKRDLSAVLHGTAFDHGDVTNQHKDVLETCLSQTVTPLKHALSVLISQMRDFNKSPSSLEEAESFYQKAVRDCLANAVDSFKNTFNSLLRTVKGVSEADALDKWVSVSEEKLKKLLESLVMSLQTLRDIPASSSKNLPLTLFHFPEPIFSMALNPAKVTHSVVLEMYVRIGLSELRRILESLLGSTEEPHGGNGLGGTSHITLLNCLDVKQEPGMNELLLNHSLSDHMKMGGMEIDSPFTTEEFVKSNHISGEVPTSSSSARPDSRHSAPEYDNLFSEVNGKSRNTIFRNTAYQARRSSESDSCHYNMFKASLGNTMVSSFKKQIQEKIQAGSIHSGWN